MEIEKKVVQVILDADELKIIQDACDLDNRTLSNFLRDAGIKKAKQILE